MVTYEHTVEIERSPEQVFAFVTTVADDGPSPLVGRATTRELRANAARLKQLLEKRGRR
jgi:hypothetical protein